MYFCVAKRRFVIPGDISPLFYYTQTCMIDKNTVLNLMQSSLDEKDLFVVALDITGNNQINVLIDSDKGVTIDECVAISRSIEHNLDREEEDFELKVSSPGLDQSLKLPRQYKKNVGREAEVLLNEGTKITGKLIEATEDHFKLEEKKRVKMEGKKKKQAVVNLHEIPYSEVKSTKIVVSFK